MGATFPSGGERDLREEARSETLLALEMGKSPPAKEHRCHLKAKKAYVNKEIVS